MEISNALHATHPSSSYFVHSQFNPEVLDINGVGSLGAFTVSFLDVNYSKVVQVKNIVIPRNGFTFTGRISSRESFFSFNTEGVLNG